MTPGNDAKNQVLAATNIVELIGQTVKLKRRGNKYVGLCPFHQEKSPSFTVDSVKQFFHCFGCKAGGNAIDFVMKRDRLEFIEAMKQLAEQANIELPRFGGQKQNASERQVLLDAHSAACGLFEKFLAHEQLGAAAREYLAQRGFNEATIKKFQIGFIPDGWDNLLRSNAMKKFSPPQLALAGLVKSREGGEGFYDTFRNRLMFPIRDEQGRIIAFGGRVMPGSQDPAKYLNSPETPLFSKSRTIFGLDFARQKIVESRTVAIVEGYTDVIMAHQYGATNVVSVLGTAMTEPHVAILRRFADRIVLLFDADSAGDMAANRAMELFLSQPVEIAIASMPAGVDPDEFLLERGLDGFEKMLASATDALSHKWQSLQQQLDASSGLTGQQQAIEEYLQLLAKARGAGPIDPIRWGGILARVSRLTDIPAGELNRRFASKQNRGRQGRSESRPLEYRSTALTATDRAERWILGVLLAEPGRWQAVQKEIGPKNFTDPDRARLAVAYWNRQRDEGEPTFSELLSELDDVDLKELAMNLLEEVEAVADMNQLLADALSQLSQTVRRQDERKLVAQLRRTNDSTEESSANEVDLLRRLTESARTPDMRRTSG